MSITTSAGDGVRITSAAKNGTLGSQSNLNGDEIRFDTAITTNNGNVDTTADFDRRMVILRRGTAGEEERKMVAVVSGNVAQVNEAWASAPASGDTYDISYICDDADGLTGFGLVTKRNTDYTLSRLFSVGNSGGGTFAYFSMTDGYSLEGHNNLGATEYDFTVEASARFSMGYALTDGTPLSGGSLFPTANGTGEGAIEVQSGGQFYAYDGLLSSVEELQTTFNGGGEVRARRVKFYAASYAMDLTGNVTLENFIIEGRGTTAENVLVSGSTTVNGLALIATNGLTNASAVHDQTITVEGVVFVNNNKDLRATASSTWNVVNPVWNPSQSAQQEIELDASGVEVNEKFSVNLSLVNAAGSAVVSAACYTVAEYDISVLVENRFVSDAEGLASTNCRTRTWTHKSAASVFVEDRISGGGTNLRFWSKVFEFAKEPQTSLLDMGTGALEVPFTLGDDTNVVTETAASALSAVTSVIFSFFYGPGTGVIPAGHPSTGGNQRNVMISYTSASSSFTVSAIVSGSVTHAKGTVWELYEDGTAGDVFLVQVSGVAQFGTAAEDLYIAGTKIAYCSASAPHECTFTIDARNYSMQVIYDWLSAKLAEQPAQKEVRAFMRASEGIVKQPLRLGQSGYYTEQFDFKGCFITNRGAGTIDRLTFDDGYEFTPPSTVAFTLTGLKTDTEVRILDASDNSIVAGIESSGTSWTYNYTYSGADLSVVVVLMHLDWNYQRITGITLSSSDQSIPVQQIVDRVYRNP